ncbi:regulator of telomere elongation helicase 1 [Hordeum vulgare]|uniref:Regulator of telomere elongation helicase 1 homolog n=2 Tax=Hordeum vulgare subsp. vulgare TaxID=112509 RepID=A0A8I6X658_HORVV|nr:regulator of telomere elongation helicase 1 homolog isoform X1 [Hordeum vulgare subsp. vulgare]KAE8791392.1 regulator of telomere elongation helicase 1 [Hordeum vulgare]
MPVYRIRGVDVDFPYDAYDCQITYMDRVLQSLQQGNNALLESPTGTGKTLCLLCSALAWRRTYGEFLRGGGAAGGSQPSGSQQSGASATQSSPYPVIIYASRTHSQLRQVIKELKATSYRPKMAVLGSREQMCIHEEVSKLRGKAQNNGCHYLCKKRRCRHNNIVTEYMKNNTELGTEPFDIEDLVNIGRTKGPCPYYISRELSKSVDILFAPYNYLIDPGNRRSLTGISWDNAVLIFDEAHNLESICADAASFDLLTSNLTSCITEAQECIQLCSFKRSTENSAEKQFDPENYAILKALLLALEKKIGELVIDSKELGYTKPGSYIYEFLSELNITSETSKKLIETIDSASLLLEEGNSGETKAGVKAKSTVSRLETIRDMLDIIFKGGGQNHAKYYSFHVNESRQTSGDSLQVYGKASRTLSWWCFNPGLAMEEFLKLGVRSIILTSGTLSPLDSLAMELNLEFPVRLENPHVISQDQIWVGVVPVGPSGHPLNSSYRTRETVKYKQELGTVIVNFARIVPDGLLVFFPSYSMMDKCIDYWKNRNHEHSVDDSTIWQRMCKHKQPVIEPRQSSNFPNAIEDYAAKLRDPSTSGAIFFAVCRGKVSEGLDFADRAGRAVIVTGMPFSTPTDPKVRLKREYLDKQAKPSNKNPKALTGEEWYVQQAARAVNQAVGRVIRHRHDYGAIIYCDERFVWPNYQSQMSYWLKPYIKCYSKYGEVVQTLTRFFRDKVCVDPKEMDCNDSVTPPADKCLPQKIVSDSPATAVNGHRGTTVSLNATTRKNNYMKFTQITPANRTTLPMKHGCSTSSQHVSSRGQISQDSQVVDLIDNAAMHGQLKEHALKSMRLKKAKIADVSSQLKHNVESRALTGNQGQQSTPPSKRSTIEQACEKNEAIQERCGGPESTTGPAFLKLAREKLSTAEYGEFVEFMKALKLKTMHIKDSLEAIAKLFSSPGRLTLLEGFRVFVSKNHLPLYEQLVKKYTMANT